jgi:hypothetical protein
MPPACLENKGADTYINDDDDDVYLHRMHSQHKLEIYAPYVKYRPAKKA